MTSTRLLNGLLLLVLGAFLAACAAGDTQETPQTPAPALETAPGQASAAVTVEPSPRPTTTARPTRTLPPPTLTSAPGHYVNPVFDRDFPDPDVLTVEEGGQVTYYAYATNSQGPDGREIHVQVASSPDLMQWTYLGEAMPALPDWAVLDFGFTWAPEVTRPAQGDGYVMYYTTRFAIGTGGGGTQCIGAATADSPEGPFRPVGEEPLVCQRDQGGSIDPAYFLDEDGVPYLLWKNDGNSQGGITWIYIQRLSPDGLALQGEPTRLIKTDKVWEGLLVEGPTLWKRDGRYYLFYSANDYSSPRYAAGVASADAVLGPYEKAPEPLLKSDLKAGIVGPGGQDVVEVGGQTWLLFHAWDAEGFRNLNLVRLDWSESGPAIAELTRDPVPGPQVDK